MGTISEEVTQVTRALHEAGLRATSDPGKINPPCVWVNLATIDHTYLAGQAELEIDLYFVTPDHGTLPAIRQLEQMISKARRVIDFTNPLEAMPVAVPSLGNTPIPALRTTITVTATID